MKANGSKQSIGDGSSSHPVLLEWSMPPSESEAPGLVPTNVMGAFVIIPSLRRDECGFFAHTWYPRDLEDLGLSTNLTRCYQTFSKKKGTLRGMYYHAPHLAEARLVQCISGIICDVVIDLRPESPTYLLHAAVLLSARNRESIYVPERCANGYMTLADDTEVLIHGSDADIPEYTRGIRWNDPVFGIAWPLDDPIVLQRDLHFPNFTTE